MVAIIACKASVSVTQRKLKQPVKVLGSAERHCPPTHYSSSYTGRGLGSSCFLLKGCFVLWENASSQHLCIYERFKTFPHSHLYFFCTNFLHILNYINSVLEALTIFNLWFFALTVPIVSLLGWLWGGFSIFQITAIPSILLWSVFYMSSQHLIKL